MQSVPCLLPVTRLQITLGFCFILMFGNSMLLTSFYASSLVSIWVSWTSSTCTPGHSIFRNQKALMRFVFYYFGWIVLWMIFCSFSFLQVIIALRDRFAQILRPGIVIWVWTDFCFYTFLFFRCNAEVLVIEKKHINILYKEEKYT